MSEPSDEAPTAAPDAPSPLSIRIERWFAEHFHSHPAMRDTETFNHVRRAVDDLKQRLDAPEQAHGDSVVGSERTAQKTGEPSQ